MRSLSSKVAFKVLKYSVSRKSTVNMKQLAHAFQYSLMGYQEAILDLRKYDSQTPD